MRNYDEKYINPIDFESNTAIGMGFPITSDSHMFFKLNYTTNEQVKDNLINLLLTQKGERINYPTYGTDLRKYVFEQPDQIDIDEIELMIKDAIAEWFPGVNIKNISVSTDIDIHKYIIKIEYNTKFDIDSNTLVININA